MRQKVFYGQKLPLDKTYPTPGCLSEALRIDLQGIAKPWPHPGAVRSLLSFPQPVSETRPHGTRHAAPFPVLFPPSFAGASGTKGRQPAASRSGGTARLAAGLLAPIQPRETSTFVSPVWDEGGFRLSQQFLFFLSSHLSSHPAPLHSCSARSSELQLPGCDARMQPRRGAASCLSPSCLPSSSPPRHPPLLEQQM